MAKPTREQIEKQLRRLVRAITAMESLNTREIITVGEYYSAYGRLETKYKASLESARNLISK